MARSSQGQFSRKVVKIADFLDLPRLPTQRYTRHIPRYYIGEISAGGVIPHQSSVISPNRTCKKVTNNNQVFISGQIKKSPTQVGLHIYTVACQYHINVVLLWNRSDL